MNERRTRGRIERGVDEVRAVLQRCSELADRLRTTSVRLREPQPSFGEREDGWFQDEELGELKSELNRLPPWESRILLAAVAMLGSTCAHVEERADHDPLHTPAVVDFSPNASADNALDISFRSVQDNRTGQRIASIALRDVNHPETWDRDLASEEDAPSVSENTLYQYHVDILREQMNVGSHDASPAPKSGLMKFDFMDRGEVAMSTHANESARLPAGIYPPLDLQLSIYGPSQELVPASFEIVHPEAFTVEVIEHAEQYGRENAWGDPQDFTAAQWIEVIDNFGVDQPYDYSLANTSAQYDPEEAAAVNRMPIDELVHREQGAVCRDFLREQLAAYAVYSEQYDLKDRGLLMLPISRFSDAGHARALFVIATGDESVTVVSTDTTNTRDRSLEQQDSTADATAVWYAQGVGDKEWFNEDVAHDFYALVSCAPDVFPTTAAIAQRELVIASLHKAEHALSNDIDERAWRSEMTEAFNNLAGKLSSQQQYEGALSAPDQMIPLFDLLVAIGGRIDIQHEQSALLSFESYRQSRQLKTEDMAMYRLGKEQINRSPIPSYPEQQPSENDIKALRASLGL